MSLRLLSALLLGAALASVTCAHTEPLSNAYSRVDASVGDRCAFGARKASGSCEVYDATVAELLAVPEKFHGKPVRVVGYVSLKFEGNVLCADDNPAAGCLWLDVEGLADPGFRKGWARVDGRFNGENRGHFGCCPGAIENIAVFKEAR